MWRESALLVILLFRFQQISATKHYVHSCLPSSCGKVTNITHPFRLKGDPDRCGDHRYELACENNVTILSLYSGKYHVQAINYNNFTIRVVDPGVRQSNCSSIPRYFLSPSNFSDTYNYLDIDMDAYQITQERSEPTYFNHIRMYEVIPKPVSEHVVFMNCNHSVSDNGKYVDTAPCVNWHSKGYTYAIAGDLISEDLEVGCNVKLVTPTSWWGLRTPQYSYSEMHKALAYGFEISWMNRACKDICANSMDRSCIWDTSGRVDCSPNCHRFLSILSICDGTPIWYQLLLYARDTIYTAWIGLVETLKGQKEFDGFGNNKLGLIIGHYVLPSFLLGKFFFGMTLFIALLIYKWKSRHLSMYENIENYLEHANLMPIRYSYKEIKKMTGGFKDKLGEGGYGSVFKGKLSSGPYVAIKMLGKSTSNGQDFISEVATIGRIHHQNIVKLVGFCVEGSKRALIYEFMPNGSLDKIIFSKDGNIHLSYDEIYHISIGIARGIAYLHHGCEMQILHFDIKPHNILLDGKLTPKVSDFGLAKLYPIDNNVVTMTGARGTIGYMAPELFYNNIGRISQKADVYSFGMLLMEMTNKRKKPKSTCTTFKSIVSSFLDL
ncbi:Rust resistance kinase [Vigna angularis]|uniref:non-specific serine/threonine protein kinase n=1 Tax=Phaseolus angularis TaxID=3914 RepID=A0A8T0JY22_PHAAN|nr:Rust resistance kinase [Vigna angularis]